MPNGDPVVRAVLERLDHHRTEASTHLNDMIEHARIFQNIPKRRTREQGQGQFANTFVMETFRDVENVASAWSSIMFGDDPWFEAMPSTPTPDAYFRARVTEQIMRKQHLEAAFRSKWDDEMRYLALFGTLVFGTEWRYSTRWIVDGDDFAQVPFLDMPDIRGLWLPAFAFDINAEDINDAEWVAEEDYAHPSLVRQTVEGARRLKRFSMGTITDPKEPIPTGQPEYDDEGGQTTQQIRQILGYQTPSRGRTSVINYWGRHPLAKPNDPDIDWRIVILNRSEKVIEIPNPYHHGQKPFLKAQCFPRRRSFYGTGLGHVLFRPQEEVNDFRNLMRDLIMFSLYHPWKKRGGPALRNSRYRLQPGKILDVAEFGDMEPLTPAIEAIQFAIALENMTKEDMRFSSGATTFTQGIQTGGTATETKFVASESSRRHLGTVMRLTDSVMRPLLMRQHEMNMQFLDRKYLVRVGNQQFMAGREDMLDDPWFDFKTPVDLDWRPVIQRRLTSAIQIIGNVVKDNPEVRVKLYPFVARLAKSFGMDPNEVLEQLEQPFQPPPLSPLDMGGAPDIPPAAGVGGPLSPEALAVLARREAARQGGREAAPGQPAPEQVAAAAENVIPQGVIAGGGL